ncbi:unnamed protein product [Nyctereutes procyonoides]|uniref:(raccoon dog) hypothetical protein n=1 Tax=Nyctereutes procyonoides TaxID=34880 RepID=A0A811YCA8_NYCPR|nr:unnamed protein product [Nyctereutes procyonoides]
MAATAAVRVPGCKKEEQRADTVTSLPTVDLSSRILYPMPRSLLLEMINANRAKVDLAARVDAMMAENLKLKSENQVLGQYIENLMSAPSVFQTTDSESQRK